MKNKILIKYEYILLVIIINFLINTIGLSILFFYSPCSLLINKKSEKSGVVINLYKDFAKEIYDNINTPLIKNLTLTKYGECPPNFEPLIFKNQYYGNFTKIYGNKTLCIERFRENEYSYRNLLKLAEFDILKKNKRKCAELIKNSNIFLYFSEEMECPLNKIEINTENIAKKLSNFFYNIGPGNYYFIPIFGSDPNNPVIINIDIINNYKICLERYNKVKDLPCEFPDNNECFFEDNYKQIFNLVSNENLNLNPGNLAKWNLANDNNINHNFCKNNLKFHIFATGYINFTQQNLKEFEEEFPPNDLTNNPLYKMYKAYKSNKNIDNFFCLISVILFCLSLIYFVIQILLFLAHKEIGILYVLYGIFLFIFKLLSIFGMMINYFCFFLKIEKVNIVLLDIPRNKLLESYFSMRKIFIIKVIFICLAWFFIICLNFIIFIFSYILKFGFDFNIFKKDIEEDKPNTKENNNADNINSHTTIKCLNSSYEKEIKLKEGDLKITISSYINTNNNSLKEITLNFICKDDINKSYIIKATRTKRFNTVIQELKEKYSELKGKNMRVFQDGSNIINKEETIEANGITNNKIIFILS